jgi:hypothetical protein
MVFTQSSVDPDSPRMMAASEVAAARSNTKMIPTFYGRVRDRFHF